MPSPNIRPSIRGHSARGPRRLWDHGPRRRPGRHASTAHGVLRRNSPTTGPAKRRQHQRFIRSPQSAPPVPTENPVRGPWHALRQDRSPVQTSLADAPSSPSRTSADSTTATVTPRSVRLANCPAGSSPDFVADDAPRLAPTLWKRGRHEGTQRSRHARGPRATMGSRPNAVMQDGSYSQQLAWWRPSGDRPGVRTRRGRRVHFGPDPIWDSMGPVGSHREESSQRGAFDPPPECTRGVT